jgi:Fur family zinc uptake transcriptional regulator
MELPLTIAEHRLSTSMSNAADRVAGIYAREGLKFTTLRRLVFEALAERSTPVGAYEILRVLGERHRKMSPVSVYRALDSLMGAGVVRKLRTQNAYFVAEAVRRNDGKTCQQRIYLICDVCHHVSETGSPAAYDMLERASASALFSLCVTGVEVSGVCDRCSVPSAGPKSRGRNRLDQRANSSG